MAPVALGALQAGAGLTWAAIGLPAELTMLNRRLSADRLIDQVRASGQ